MTNKNKKIWEGGGPPPAPREVDCLGVLDMLVLMGTEWRVLHGQTQDNE